MTDDWGDKYSHTEINRKCVLMYCIIHCKYVQGLCQLKVFQFLKIRFYLYVCVCVFMHTCMPRVHGYMWRYFKSFISSTSYLKSSLDSGLTAVDPIKLICLSRLVFMHVNYLLDLYSIKKPKQDALCLQCLTRHWELTQWYTVIDVPAEGPAHLRCNFYPFRMHSGTGSSLRILMEAYACYK